MAHSLGVRHDVLGQYVTLGLMKDLGPLLKRDQSVKLADHLPSAVDMLSFKSKQFLQAAAAGRPTPKATKWSDMPAVIDEHLQAADTGKLSVRAAVESLDRQLIPFLAQ